MEFQKYNVLEKKKKKRNKNKNKQSHKNYKEDIVTKLITNTKKQKLKSRVEFGTSKYNVKEKKKKKKEKKQTNKNKQSHKIIKKI